MTTTLIINNEDEDFRHILRIYNTNIDGRRRVPFALRAIKGIGRRFAIIVCKICKVDVNKRAGELTAAECKKLTDVIDHPEENGIPKYLFNRQYDYKTGQYQHCVSNDLDTKLREDLERMKKVRSNRGLRHQLRLKVRGQHTKSTGRRGATVGVQKKK